MPDQALDDDDRDWFRIDRARQVARVLRRLGWLTLATGVLALVGTTYFYATGEIDFEKFFTLIVGSVLVTVMTGATAYAASMNLTLSASRLARVLPPQPGDSADGQQS
jgi:hypothetical protein